MKNYLFILLGILALQACGISMGDRIDSGNLSVYFLKEVKKEQAIKFTKYWRENGFVGERKQVIQLEKVEGIIQIKLIERESYQEDEITLNEEVLLQDLERDLKKNVFHEKVEIIITDNTFRPILKRK